MIRFLRLLAVVLALKVSLAHCRDLSSAKPEDLGIPPERIQTIANHVQSLVGMSPDYPVADNHRYISGGGGLSGTAMDYMRFCQMILNQGELGGTPILKPTTVKLMTTNTVEIEEFKPLGKVPFRFGLGFSVFPESDGMRGEVGWGGIWGTVFCISRGGNWAAALLTQRVLDQSSLTREADFIRIVREAFRELLANSSSKSPRHAR